MRVLGVIPARYNSHRFPGKILEKIGTKPMVQWVWESARKCEDLDHLVIAADSERIREAAIAFGAEVLMTSNKHLSGTDRLAETALTYSDYDIIVNIQGDEPGIDRELISSVIRLKLEHPEWEISTAVRPFADDEDPLVPERVKAVLSRQNKALYFSRSLIPFPRNKSMESIYLHLGIYAYQRAFLLRFSALPATPLEKTEALEQLRVLENDYNIGVCIVESSLPSVDTPEDLMKIKHIFKQRNWI